MPKTKPGGPSFREILEMAKGKPELVRIGRHRLEEETVFSDGYVADVSDSLVLLNWLSSRIDLDGFEVLRLADVTVALTEWPAKRFYERGLELKGIRPQAPAGPIRIGDLREAVRSIGDAYPLLTVFREKKFPDECDIGRVGEVLKTGFRMRYLTPRAEWWPREDFYRYSEITRLDFGGEYERTLALVAATDHGEPPESGAGD